MRMREDPKLTKAILLRLAEDETSPRLPSIEYEGHSLEEVMDHMGRLAAKGLIRSGKADGGFIPRGLTDEGREVVDTVLRGSSESLPDEAESDASATASGAGPEQGRGAHAVHDEELMWKRILATLERQTSEIADKQDMSPGLVFRGPENLSEDLDVLTPGEIREALSYMEEEGLVKLHPGTPTRDAFLQPRTYTITQKGRERIRGDGWAAPTPPVQNIFNAPVGAVQTGAGSQATIVQSSTTGREEILKLLRELRAVVEEIGDDSAREILKEDLEGVEEEVRSESPKPGKTRSFIRTFLAHAPGTIAASNQLLSLLE